MLVPAHSVSTGFAHYLFLFLSKQLTLLMDVTYRDSLPLWKYLTEPGRNSKSVILKRLNEINRKKFKINNYLNAISNCVFNMAVLTILLKMLLNPTEQL